MSDQPDYTDASGNPITQEQAERYAMVAEARRVGEAQQRSQRVLSELQAGPDLAAMVPPEYRHNPRAYIDRMAAKGHDAVAPRVLDSSKVGDYVIDPNILRSCTTPGGFECPASALKPDGLVNYMGMTIKAAQAVQMGVLEMDEHGVFRVPDGEARKAETQAEQAEAKRQHEAEIEALRASGDEPDAALQQAINLASSRVPPHATSAIVEDAISNGDISASAIAQVSKAAGLTEDQGAGLVHEMWNGFARQAAAAVTSVGVPPGEVDAVWAFAAEKYPIDHKNGVRTMVLMSDTSPFKRIAKQYLAWRRAGGR